MSRVLNYRCTIHQSAAYDRNAHKRRSVQREISREQELFSKFIIRRRRRRQYYQTKLTANK